MNLDNYRSFGSFAPVYTEAVKRIYDCYPPDRAKQAEAVLRAYGEHADQYGTCFPAMRTIMKRTHYSETTYKRCMTMLGELDYMRVHVEYSIARRRDIVTYQLSPWVLFISRDWIESAISLWNSTKLRCNEIIHAQPESEPESEPEPEPESPTRIRTTTTTKTGKSQNPQYRKSENAKKGLKNAQNQRVAPENRPEGSESPERSSDTEKPARSAKSKQNSVPPPPDIKLCRDPLPAGQQEQLALDIKEAMNTRISQSRQLILWFGYEAVEAGFAWWKVENAKKPAGFGLLKWWLQHRIITGEDKPKPKEAGLFGQYADMFGGD